MAVSRELVAASTVPASVDEYLSELAGVGSELDTPEGPSGNFATDLTEYLQAMLRFRAAIIGAPSRPAEISEERSVVLDTTTGEIPEGFTQLYQVPIEGPTFSILAKVLVLESLGYPMQFSDGEHPFRVARVFRNHVAVYVRTEHVEELDKIFKAHTSGPLESLWGLTAEGGIDGVDEQLEHNARCRQQYSPDPAIERRLAQRGFMTSRFMWGAREALEGRRRPREAFVHFMDPKFWQSEDRRREEYDRLRAQGVTPFSVAEMYKMATIAVLAAMRKLDITPPNARNKGGSTEGSDSQALE